MRVRVVDTEEKLIKHVNSLPRSKEIDMRCCYIPTKPLWVLRVQQKTPE